MSGRLVRTVRAWAVTIACGYAVLSAAIGIAMAEGAMRLPRKPLDEAAAARVAREAEAAGIERTDVTMTSADGLRHQGWLFRPRTPNGRSVLLLHGQADNRIAVSATALWLAREGFAVLTPDARGHGASAATLITYGVREADDARRWLRVLREHSAQGCSYLIGQSMGAAIALQALPAPGVCGVVAESPFASLREIAADRLAAAMRVPDWVPRSVLAVPVAAGLLYARNVRRIDLTRADPARSARDTDVPILLVHGLADDNIPARHSALIKTRAPQADVWLVSGARHTAVWSTAPEEYRRRVMLFLNQSAPPINR